MPVTIITKNTASAGVAPSAGQLVQGELAVNVTDKRLYTLNSSNQVVLISSGSDYIVPVTIDVNSASAALRITQTGSGNALLVEDSTNPDSTPFVIDSNGRTIIGNTATLPAGESWPLQVQGAGSTGAAFARFSADSTATQLSFIKSRNTTVGSYGAVVNSGDSLGTIQFAGDDGTNRIPGASIIAAVDGTPGTNDMPGRLVFSTTADGASTLTERLRIASTGAIGLSGANYGTAGQVLTSNGSGSAPSWQAAGGGVSIGKSIAMAMIFGF